MKFYWVLALTLLTGCNDESNGKSMSLEPPLIKIELEQAIDTLTTASPVEFSKECLDEADMCWYRIGRAASDPLLPTFEVRHGGRTLRLQQATDISITGTSTTTGLICTCGHGGATRKAPQWKKPPTWSPWNS
jgi:hypothetical protein